MVGTDGHGTEAAAAPPHLMECPQHNPALDARESYTWMNLSFKSFSSIGES